MPFIYKITNDINDKVYIGKTRYTIEERWREHCNDMKKSRNEKRPLYDAMRKYGIEHFTIEPIEECSIDELNEREVYWIQQYNSFHFGYNATVGGDGKFYLDYDKIYQTYQETLSCKQTAEIVGCCEDSVSDVLIKIYGISSETLQKNSKILRMKKVAMLDKNTSEVLNVFNSAKDAGEFIGKPRRHIQEVCAGHRNTAYGYAWSYVTE